MEISAEELMKQAEANGTLTTKIKIYSIKDLKEGKFAQPFYFINDAMAKRALFGSVNYGEKGKSTLADYPTDYDLYKLGEYDEKTGELKTDIKFICNAGDLKNKEYKEI